MAWHTSVMGSEPGPRLAIELVRAVGTLAASATRQSEIVIAAGLYPLVDELALNFDDLARLVPQFVERSLITDSEAAIVADLQKLLERMGSQLHLWKADALTGPEWGAVRSGAARFFDV